ncbi:MAG: hypothetical protein AABY55_00495 [Candidatus Omnitrophota bacterium]
MTKKNIVLFFILVIALLFIFSPAFSTLLEFLSGERDRKQQLKEWRKAYEQYWNEEYRSRKSLWEEYKVK